MDSVTQFALGAVVGAAVLGPKIGPRKAIIMGGVFGTLPDLDSFLPAEDAVKSFTSHRGATHSLIVQAVVTPLFAEPLMRMFQGLKDQRIRTYAAIFLVFATHALIDAMTIYGTRLFWPLYSEPVGLGSIFIIDPLYALPLLVAVVWALCLGRWTLGIARISHWALGLSTAYMLATIPLQQWAHAKSAALLADKGIEADRVLTIAAPFTTLFWKTIVIDGPRYLNVYVPLLGDQNDITIYSHPRRLDLATCLVDDPVYMELTDFNDGFYTVGREGEYVVISDLRMGLTPQYVFRFAVAEGMAGKLTSLTKPIRRPVQRGAEGDTDWLLAGITGNAAPRPTETGAQVAIDDLQPRGMKIAMIGCGSGQG